MTQTIRVNYYAQLREALKRDSEDVTVALPARERDILDRLAELHPRQRDLFLASRIAVNEDYVDARDLFNDLKRVDVISPISGG
ncbi:MAG: hypothetical protein JWP91_958 [Fibrobacteres bacterium]|nr:hypothetical protein [Fibrobacterota bacterium]